MKQKVLILIAVLAMLILLGALAYADRTGKQVYDASCKMCHNSGLMGAPVIGDKSWAMHLKGHGGMEGLMKIAIKGKGSMPPMGTCKKCTEAELRAAIEYMINPGK